MYHVVKTIINLPWLGMVVTMRFSMPIKMLTGGCKWHRFTNVNQWSGCPELGSSQRRFRIPLLLGSPRETWPGLSASAARATGLPGDFSIEKVLIQPAIVIYITRKSCDLSMKHVDFIKISSNKNGDEKWDIYHGNLWPKHIRTGCVWNWSNWGIPFSISSN